MNKFTKEEINLCKQVVEKYRKKIKRRQYFYNTFLKRVQWSGEGGQSQALWAIPLWTISDCLEFLRERAFYLEGLCQIDECEYECCVSELDDLGIVRGTKRRFEGKTPLEACLKTVLAISKEK